MEEVADAQGTFEDGVMNAYGSLENALTSSMSIIDSIPVLRLCRIRIFD